MNRGLVRLDEFFEITNGTKTGVFIVFSRDQSIGSLVNAIPSESNLGKYFLNLPNTTTVFLLETLKNIYEGFWVSKNSNVKVIGTDTLDREIEYGADKDFLPGRIEGHLVRGTISLPAEKQICWLSDMTPNFDSNSDFFNFSTTWSPEEIGNREQIRKLNRNFNLNLDELRSRAKYFPIEKGPNSEQKVRREKFIEIGEKLKSLTIQSKYEELRQIITQAKVMIVEFNQDFGSDEYSNFLCDRILLIEELILN